MLFTEKVAGNVRGCIGFIQDRHTRLNVPNTLLKKDIRDITQKITQTINIQLLKNWTRKLTSIYVVFQKK